MLRWDSRKRGIAIGTADAMGRYRTGKRRNLKGCSPREPDRQDWGALYGVAGLESGTEAFGAASRENRGHAEDCTLTACLRIAQPALPWLPPRHHVARYGTRDGIRMVPPDQGYPGSQVRCDTCYPIEGPRMGLPQLLRDVDTLFHELWDTVRQQKIACSKSAKHGKC